MGMDKIEIGTYINNDGNKVNIIHYHKEGNYFVGENHNGDIHKYSTYGKSIGRTPTYNLNRKVKTISFNLYLNLYSDGMYEYFECEDDSENDVKKYCIENNVKLLERIHIRKEFEV